MTAMRILLIGPVPPEFGGRDTGGIATHNRGLAEHLAARGHGVAILADSRHFDPEAWPARIGALSVYGVADFSGERRLAELGRSATWMDVARARRTLGGVGSSRWITAATAAYRSVVRDFAPDLVHVHALEGRFAFANAVLSRRTPLVATAHSTHYFEFVEPARRDLHRRLVARNLAAAREVIFVSSYLKQRYETLFPAAIERLNARIIPNPIDAAAFPQIDRAAARRSLGLQASERTVAFVGNLIPRKDAGSLIRAVALLSREGAPVTALIVGAGPEDGGLRALAASEGVAAQVRFEGGRLQSELGTYYAAADALVFPSLMESFGLVAVEAMLYGTPVVGTPEVLPEVVPPECGVYAPPGDPESLARAIGEALERTWDREAIRAHALTFDWRGRVGEYEAAYEDVVAAWRR
jgi:glycosyltransferase involved in cell wall biosynthesis